MSDDQVGCEWVSVSSGVCVCIFFNAWRKLVNFFTYLNESISYNSVYLTLTCVKIFV